MNIAALLDQPLPLFGEVNDGSDDCRNIVKIYGYSSNHFLKVLECFNISEIKSYFLHTQR